MGNQPCVSGRDKGRKLSHMEKKFLYDIDVKKAELMRAYTQYQGPNFASKDSLHLE